MACLSCFKVGTIAKPCAQVIVLFLQSKNYFDGKSIQVIERNVSVSPSKQTKVQILKKMFVTYNLLLIFLE